MSPLAFFRSLMILLRLRRFFPTITLWSAVDMAATLDPVKLTEEFQTFLNLDAVAGTAEATSHDAHTDLANVVDAENAKIAAVQAAADTATAAAQQIADAADAEATAARNLADAQKYYIGGLLGITPPTQDPTPTV